MSKEQSFLEKLMFEIHPKLGSIYKTNAQFQRLVKFTIIAFIPFLPTLFIASAFGFWMGLAWAVGTHLLKFILNDLWTWKKRKEK